MNQRDAEPNIDVRWVYGFSGLVSEVSVNPSFPPRVAGPDWGGSNINALWIYSFSGLVSEVYPSGA